MDNTLAKINALLAKAESTDSTHEAEALLAKAQELMTKHAIDEGMLDSNKKKGEVIDNEILTLGVKGGKGNASLLMLLTAVGKANSVKVFRYGTWQHASMVGYPSDIQATKIMFAALQLQLFSSELASRKNKPSHVHGTTWRVSFYEGFATRMGVKLSQAREAASEQARAQYGAGSDIVLVSKEEKIKQWSQDNLDLARFSWSSSARSDAGYRAGSNAADRAGSGSTSIGSERTAALGG